MTLNLYACTRGVRKTTSGLVSVLDVIRVIKGCSRETACALYHKLVRDQLVPTFPKFLFKTGTQQRPTPVGSARDIMKLIFALPGKHNFRKECADLYMRYIGGQSELIDEVLHWNSEGTAGVGLLDPCIVDLENTAELAGIQPKTLDAYSRGH